MVGPAGRSPERASAARAQRGPVRGQSVMITLCTALSLLLAACSPGPVPAAPLDVNAAAATLVAMTFEAATQSAAMQPPTAPPAYTATFVAPRLYIKIEVQCRTGIGSNFKVLATLPAGTLVDMVGRYSAQAAWLVQVPGSPSPCWVLAQDSSPSGSFDGLPEVTPQPGSGLPPSAPTVLNWPFYCTYVDGVLYEIKTNLSWTNTASDANGFRVYRQEVLVADLPASLTSYSDTGRVELGTNLTYSVEAYNDAGTSPRLSHTIASVCK
jgi:hypothetical protein